MVLQICLLTETYYPVVGGGERQAQILAEGLVTQGAAVTILTRRTDRSQPRKEKSGGALIHRLPPVGHFHLKKWGLMFSCLWGLWHYRRRYSLIFVSGFRVVGAAAVFMGHLLGKKVVLKADSIGEMSGAFFDEGLAQWGLASSNWLLTRFLRRRNNRLLQADRFVAISSVIREELIAADVPAEHITSIANSVDTTIYHPVSSEEKTAIRRRLGLPMGGQIVIYTGRLVRLKGLPLLVKTWACLQDEFPQARLLLVGTGGLSIGNCEAELKAMAREKQLTSVTFTGQVDNVADYLQAADIFILPSENEAFGISLIEAMACGLPAITTTAGGLSDILTSGIEGLTVEIGHQQQLGDALKLLLSQPKIGQRMGHLARKRCLEHFSTEAFIAQMAALFAEFEVDRISRKGL